MIYLLTLLVTVTYLIVCFCNMQVNRMGSGWTIAMLIILFLSGCALIFLGVTAEPGSRSVLLQMGAGTLTVVAIAFALNAYINRRGW